MSVNEKSRFIDPTRDYGFKIMYGLEERANELKDLLEHIIPDKKIKSLTYLPTEELATDENKKKVVCDVKCQDENGDYFIVEMQRSSYEDFPDRLMIYASRTASKLLAKGESYSNVKSLYVISVLDYVLKLEGDDEECRKKCVREAMTCMLDSGTVLSDKIKFIFLQLPQGSNEASEWVKKWSWYMKHIHSSNEMPRFSQEDAHFERMYYLAERCNIEPSLLKEYDDMIRDEIQIEAEKKYAVKEAVEEAVEALEKNFRAALQKAAEENRQDKRNTVLNLMGLKFSIEEIAKIVNLSPEEVSALISK